MTTPFGQQVAENQYFTGKVKLKKMRNIKWEDAIWLFDAISITTDLFVHYNLPGHTINLPIIFLERSAGSTSPVQFAVNI